ncbi:MAG: putative transcriptional regulator [Chloroflexi bacterium]|nr:putative transcriptional regulator [Chloroflexota bacterium]
MSQTNNHSQAASEPDASAPIDGELSDFCPRYHHAVELIGRRWTGVILRMLLKGPRRFNELLTTIPGLSDRLLTDRLRELEAEGLVVRRVLPNSPVRVEYELTEQGRDLGQSVRAISIWAEKWIAADDAHTLHG